MTSIVITGSSAGIGAAAAVELTRLGHTVLTTGRSSEKLERVRRRLQSVAPEGTTVPVPITSDLSTRVAVEQFAEQVAVTMPEVSVLVNNLGIQPHARRLTPDGTEETFAVNHLAPFLLSTLLGDRLRANRGRIVMTSSSSHAKVDPRLDDPQLEQGWTASTAYGRSKLYNILFTLEARHRLALPVSAFHPGAIRTEINRESPYVRYVKPFERFLLGSPEKGADTGVWLASSAEGGEPRGLYYAKRRVVEPDPAAVDPSSAATLWDLSERLLV